MFRVAKIPDVSHLHFFEKSIKLEDCFFFTTKMTSYYVIYNKQIEIIGKIPCDYHLFFRLDDAEFFEDIDIENLVRIHTQGVKFQLLATDADNQKVEFLDSANIAKIVKIEDEVVVPFTNHIFSSENILVYKNPNSLSEIMSMEIT